MSLKIVVKRYLQKGWCEPASGKDNGISGRCESVVVIPSEGGNTSAYLATERYRSMPIQPSACHSQYRLVPVGVPENGTTESVCLYYTVFGSASDGSYSSLCSWMDGAAMRPFSAISHCSRHGKLITDATLERQVSISPMPVSVASRLRMRFLPMFHCDESCSSEYCA